VTLLILSVLGAFLIKLPAVQVTLSLLSAWALSRLIKTSKRPTLHLYLSFSVIHLIAFYWLPETLQIFGGFPFAFALVLHLLFALSAAMQYALAGYIYSRFYPGRTGMFAVVYGLIDLLFPRLFPWTLANPLLCFSQLSSLAELCGVTVLTALLLYAFECPRLKGAALAVLLLSLGTFLDLRIPEGEKIKVGLIQGNIGLEAKRARDELSENLAVYNRLSREAVGRGAKLLVWPESVMTEWTPTVVKRLPESPYEVLESDLQVPLIYGALTFERNLQAPKGYASYNGAILRSELGEVLGNYAKIVLMPFGEFLPFESTFPWLRDLSPATGNFQRGVSLEPLVLGNVRSSALICYEDLVAELAREGVRRGGNLLVNLTNDAWYGDTLALWQHQWLAQWRAIEFRRSLLRATNTGLTSVTLPDGRMLSHLPTFAEGVLVEEVPLLEVRTVYSYLGDEFFILLLALFALFVRLRTR
jgi:apolipoprotein N-acyltransferase